MSGTSTEIAIADHRLSQQGPELDWSKHIARALFGKESRIFVNNQYELDTLTKQARENKALARTFSRVETRNPSLIPRIHDTISDSQNRLEDAFSLLSSAQRVLSNAGVPFAVIKSLDGLPDMGHDIDLLVGANLSRVKSRLLKAFRCAEVTLTFCDRQAGKFSSFIEGYSSDLELYTAISQLGERYYPDGLVLARRYWDKDLNGGTYLCSFEDRLLITCIHALYRHGRIRLSDFRTVHRSLSVDLDLNYVLSVVESSGTKEGFAVFMKLLDKVGRDDLDMELLPEEVKSYSDNVLKSNPLLAALVGRLRTRFPVSVPAWMTALLFLHKAWADLVHSKPESFARSIVAPLLLLMYKSVPLRLQKAVRIQIW